MGVGPSVRGNGLNACKSSDPCCCFTTSNHPITTIHFITNIDLVTSIHDAAHFSTPIVLLWCCVGSRGGSFLISGGTGALGQLAATWVTTWGPADVCLLSRKGSDGPPPGHADPSSGTCRVMRCDVTSCDEMSSLVHRGRFSDILHAGTQCFAHLSAVSHTPDMLVWNALDIQVVFSTHQKCWCAMLWKLILHFDRSGMLNTMLGKFICGILQIRHAGMLAWEHESGVLYKPQCPGTGRKGVNRTGGGLLPRNGCV